MTIGGNEKSMVNLGAVRDPVMSGLSFAPLLSSIALRERPKGGYLGQHFECGPQHINSISLCGK